MSLVRAFSVWEVECIFNVNAQVNGTFKTAKVMTCHRCRCKHIIMKILRSDAPELMKIHTREINECGTNAKNSSCNRYGQRLD